jgi:DNA invertase Pin-like site-specific DNA recombinase
MAYIYCRVSSVRQIDGVSMEVQEDVLTKTVKTLGLNVLHIQKVISSAYTSVPKEFEMYYKLSNKKLFVYSVDRYSRNVEYGLESARKLIKNGNV